jgi:iron uptake system EfeUOB component EfeO/EfeM
MARARRFGAEHSLKSSLERAWSAIGRAWCLGFVLATALLTAATASRAEPEALDGAAERYRPLMIRDIDEALAGAKALQERIAARDLAGAQKAWIGARAGWERAEVFTAGYVSELDEMIDAWPNALTGFHAIEAKLFGAKSLDIGDETGALVFHLADLDMKIHYTPLSAQGLLNGTARLAYEVGENKADGGESRYSGTSLNDMRNNVAGIALAYKTIFAAALKAADPKLAAATQANIDDLTALVTVPDLESLDPDRVRAKSEDLVLALQSAAPKLGLIAPTLEDLTQ